MGLHHTGLADLHIKIKTRKHNKGTEQMYASQQNRHPCHRVGTQVVHRLF